MQIPRIHLLLRRILVPEQELYLGTVEGFAHSLHGYALSCLYPKSAETAPCGLCATGHSLRDLVACNENVTPWALSTHCISVPPALSAGGQTWASPV